MKKAEDSLSQAKADNETTRQERAEWEDEKKRITTTHTFDSMIKLNVGGRLLTTTLATLTRFPDTMLGAMFSGRHALIKDENGAYFIDRDGRHFESILNFLRAPSSYTRAVLQKRGDTSELEIEADYYGLKDLMFPTLPIRPFVKVATVAVSTAAPGMKTLVGQDDAGLWYMEGSSPPPSLVTVCDTCGWGQPSSLPSATHYQYGVPRFTTGRTIIDAQPRKTGVCNWNGIFCSCE
jgi:hypothetical protein